MDSLRSLLAYEPHELKFGTSGRRGEVIHLTQLEIYVNVLGELEYLLSLSPGDGGIVQGDDFYLAYDLRPSSTRFVQEQQGRGEIAQTVCQAVSDAGLRPVNLGPIPTPALAFYSFARRKGSIMVTGSHIPFDRNGYKLNTSAGELLKSHEAPVNEAVANVRKRIYAQPFAECQFDHWGFLRCGHAELPPVDEAAESAYVRRYLEFFAGKSLGGAPIVVYQHSAVGRDLLASVLTSLGAHVVTAGRSDRFVPIDTENIDAAQLAAIQDLVDAHPSAVAVVSMDGDSDRPLVLGVRPESGKVQFFGGDLLGMVAAEYLCADSVVVPISSNDAIDRGNLARFVEPKTRIGSPFVIEGMERARKSGRKVVCGWEANGGFLTGSDIVRDEHSLTALPTRDAMLPILCVLFAAREKGLSLSEVFAQLPRRFSRAGLLREFPNAVARRLLDSLTPALLHEQFSPALGFGSITKIDRTDGVRVSFSNGDIAHLRASGNADELRIYAVADSQQRADDIVQLGVAEPDGALRKLEKLVSAPRPTDSVTTSTT